MLKSNATLKERLAGWTDPDIVMYHIGVCLGFWPDFGAPGLHDPWHGMKSIMWSANPLGDAISAFMTSLFKAGMLEQNDEHQYRWNKEYKELDDES